MNEEWAKWEMELEQNEECCMENGQKKKIN